MYNTATQRHTETWTGTDYANAVTDVVYGYNNMGELASVTVLKENGQTPAAVASSTIYDALGNTSTTTLPNTVYTYGGGGRLTSGFDSATGITTKYTYKPDTNYVSEVKTTNGAGTVLADDTYTFRAGGLKTGAIKYTLNADGSSDTVTLTWNYDGLDRLTSESSSDTAGVAALNYTDEYKYDLDSNRTTETIENGSGTVTGTITSTYNADNQLTQSVDANNGTTVFSYDLDGNQIGTVHTPNGSTTPDSTTTSEYTLQDKLAGIQNKNGSGAVTSSALYIYDDQGNRVEVTTVTGSNSPVTTYFLVDGNNPTGYAQVIEQSVTPGAPTITYIWGGSLIQQDNAAGTTNAGIYYLIADGQGSTQVLVSSTGDVVQTYNYDSSGNALGFAPDSAITDYLYNQQYYDIISGQYYMRARNYDPATGTFTQQDSYTINPGDTANANLCLFTGADPINMVDPSGQFGLMSTLGSIAIGMVLNSAISTVAAPFASEIGSMLIPSGVLQAIEGAAGSANAVVINLGGALGYSYDGLAGGFGAGGLELLISPHAGGIAVYRYGGGGISLGGAAGVSGALTVSAGAVWRTPSSTDYTKWFETVSLGFRLLPELARNAMEKDLLLLAQTAAMLTPSNQRLESLFQQFGQSGYVSDMALQRALDGTLALRQAIQNSNSVANIFWSPAANGSVGFSVGESMGSAEGGFSLSYSGTYYQQIWPYGRVWF